MIFLCSLCMQWLNGSTHRIIFSRNTQVLKGFECARRQRSCDKFICRYEGFFYSPPFSLARKGHHCWFKKWEGIMGGRYKSPLILQIETDVEWKIFCIFNFTFTICLIFVWSLFQARRMLKEGKREIFYEKNFSVTVKISFKNEVLNPMLWTS